MTRHFPWITFLTDYGLENKFTGACRGVMARTAPHATVVDITHLVPRGDIRHGALVLQQAIRYLPGNSVHLAVVDPGVGTARRAICVVAGDGVLIGPDNGLLPWAAEEIGGARAAFELTNLDRFALSPMSTSFHGRDLFSPAAAYVAGGVDLAELGAEISVESLVRLPSPVLSMDAGSIWAEVLIVDRFGNLQTSIDKPALEHLSLEPGQKLEISNGKRSEPVPLTDTFADVAEGKLLAHIDSAGLLAVAVNLGNAAEVLGVEPGDMLTVSAFR